MTKVLIWDAEDAPPPVKERLTVLWRAFADISDVNVVSIPSLIETNAENLRTRYLTWIYDLGEAKIRGKRLIDHLEIRPGFSYWWMTLLAEKCNFSKSPQINDAIRLLAFEHWLDKRSLSSITLVSTNAGLAEILRIFCRQSGISFGHHPRPLVKEQIFWAKRFYRLLPYPVRSLTWLVIYLVTRWPLKSVGITEWRASTGKVAFISYLYNLVPDAVQKGCFESRNWGPLPNNLRQKNCKTNWLHIYVVNDLLPNAAKAAASIRQFNITGQGNQIHATMDSFLSLTVILKTLRDGFRLLSMRRLLRLKLISTDVTKFDLLPLFQEDWTKSFEGPDAIGNVLNLNLFESALGSLPQQQVGVYLQENQGWEFALIHAWQAAGHQRLIGFAHSTVRFWDLRYFFSPQSYCDIGQPGVPRPHSVAVNGAAARDAYLAGGYPEHELLVVESLRYFHLLEPGVADRQAVDQPGAPLRILALGDYVASNTEKGVRLLEKAAQFLPVDAIFTIKPHPACPVAPLDYPCMKMTVTMAPVAQLLAACDVAYSCSNTSAAVDAYCAGVPVVSMLDPDILNLSPLRGCEGAIFARTATELAEALLTCAAMPASSGKALAFFALDSGLPGWRKALRISGCPN